MECMPVIITLNSVCENKTKTFYCDSCYTSFRTERGYNMHMASHSGPKSSKSLKDILNEYKNSKGKTNIFRAKGIKMDADDEIDNVLDSSTINTSEKSITDNKISNTEEDDIEDVIIDSNNIKRGTINDIAGGSADNTTRDSVDNVIDHSASSTIQTAGVNMIDEADDRSNGVISTTLTLPKLTSTHKCFTCGKPCLTLKSMIIHSRDCNPTSPSRHICDICNKEFDNSHDLTKHEKTFKTSSKFTCDICGKSFHELHHLVHHKKYVHSVKSSFSCPTCDRRYKSANALKSHLSRHELQKHVCCYCKEDFKNKTELRNHICPYFDQDNYSCDICGKNFVLQSNFLSHSKTHEKN